MQKDSREQCVLLHISDHYDHIFSELSAVGPIKQCGEVECSLNLRVGLPHSFFYILHCSTFGMEELKNFLAAVRFPTCNLRNRCLLPRRRRTSKILQSFSDPSPHLLHQGNKVFERTQRSPDNGFGQSWKFVNPCSLDHIYLCSSGAIFFFRQLLSK